MNVVHLTDSPFFGGPERQMLGLAVNLPPRIHTTILCFRDNNSSVPFLERLREAGIDSRMLPHANPRFIRIIGDIVAELRAARANVLLCHGYKADILGWTAARLVGIPVLAVSRGWTGHTAKVRLNEALDRLVLRRMDGVVCVSGGQADKVRRAGVAPERVHVSRNSVAPTRFSITEASGREPLEGLFAHSPDVIVVGVGRLTSEKGFDYLIDAARRVVANEPGTGFVLIGDGPERGRLEAAVSSAGLQDRVVFAGFRTDVDRLVAGADILAQSSTTEGLPNVVLEACAAGVAVVATDVGGTSEVIRDGHNGYLVPPRDPALTAERLVELVRAPALRRIMGERGRGVINAEFGFTQQCAQYERLLDAAVTWA